jgi:hypothetical protein
MRHEEEEEQLSLRLLHEFLLHYQGRQPFTKASSILSMATSMDKLANYQKNQQKGSGAYQSSATPGEACTAQLFTKLASPEKEK